MSELSLEEYFHDFRQDILASAEANMDFLEPEFTQKVANELVDSGVVEGFDPCHYRQPTGGIRVDGYWYNDISIDLFITDYANRETLESLTQTEVTQIFKRAENFFTISAEKKLFVNLEETTEAYGLSRTIATHGKSFSKVNFFLLSERVLSERVNVLEDKQEGERVFSYNIWDMSRLYRLYTSKGSREALEINFVDMIGEGLPCLPAHFDSATYKSYLVVMPATVLAKLYQQYGARLLEQNVRSFLQIRGGVNKGIRATIMHDPEMFFAYNNGITATAKVVEVVEQGDHVSLTSLTDLQIVNGGQTTATLFQTHYKDNAPLDKIFVQMKLSVIDAEKSEEVVPRISEYANTQNKVNAADFFSNHAYHVRMEEFSRRIWSPALKGAQRETKWFYERARGQYMDAQSKLTPSEKRRFLAEYPKPQMFTKTDLAKFENVWDNEPVKVNLGAQKNFGFYAERIGQEWEQNSDKFNEFYFKRAIARAIIFRRTEKIVSHESWYSGGYRANVVAYTIAMLAKVCSSAGLVFDFMRVWNLQSITPSTEEAIKITAELVHDDITSPRGNISNVTEWCKREACWIQLQSRIQELMELLPARFFRELITADEEEDAARTSSKVQKMTSGIEAQKAVYEIPVEVWAEILRKGQQEQIFSPKEISILRIATQIPHKMPTDKQSFVLLDILEKAKREAIYY